MRHQLGRKRHNEAGACFSIAFHLDGATMRFDDGFGEVQTEAGGGFACRAWASGRRKFVEYPVPHMFGYADSRITHHQKYAVARGRSGG